MKHLLNQFKLHIFDFDGTLVDTTNIWVEINKKHLEQHGLKYEHEKFRKDICGKNFDEVCKIISSNYINKDWEIIKNELLEMSTAAYSNVKYKPFALEYLSLLKEQGCKIVLCTANKRELIAKSLKNYISNFDLVVTSDDFDSKDKTVLYQHIHDTYSNQGYATEDTVVYEDSMGGFQCANNVFKHIVLIRDPHNVYEETIPYLCEIRDFSGLI